MENKFLEFLMIVFLGESFYLYNLLEEIKKEVIINEFKEIF